MESSITTEGATNQSEHDLARAKLMSAKKAAKTEKKRRQLRNQKLYRKNKKRQKNNSERSKSKKGGGPFPLPEVVHSSSGVSGGPDGNVKEDFLADGVTGTRICGVQAEGCREIDGVGCTGSLPTGEYNASGHDGDTNSVVAGDAVDLEDHHGVGDETFQTSWLMHDSNRKCDNCHRRCFTDDVSSPYYFDMCAVYSHNIKQLQSPLRKIKSHQSKSRETAVAGARRRGENDRYNLCRECYTFLSTSEAESDASKEEKLRLNKRRFHWSNIWPSFYWDLLVGDDATIGSPFHTVYSPSHLWRFVPQSIRQYWLHEECFCSGGAYFGCTESTPSSFFRDRTNDLAEFRRNINSYTTIGFLNALDPSRLANRNDDVSSFLVPDVLCPWGCGEYCHCAVPFDPSLLIQRHLTRVQLNLSRYNGHDKLYLVENSRLDYIKLDNEPVDTVLLNDDWQVLPSVVLDENLGLSVLYCRHHSSPASQRRLYTHPPKKVDNSLCSTRPDNLAHCVLKPRCVSSIKAHTYNTTMTANIFCCGFAGSDSADVIRDSKYGWTPSLMLFNHEVWSIIGRGDIRSLAAGKLNEGKISPELHEQWFGERQKRCSSRKVDISMALRGSTFVPTFNALKLQQHSTEESRITVTLCSRHRTGGEYIAVESQVLRSWTSVIGNIQVEDPDNYGSMVKGIKPYNGRKNSATMMLWVLVGMTSCCNDLHYAIDQKQGGHHFDNFTGYLLAHINAHYMKHRDSTCPRKSPFSGRKSSSFLLKKIENCLPPRMNSEVPRDDESFYRFDLEYMSNLFPADQFPTIGLCSDIAEVQYDLTGRFSSNQDIFISVGKRRPDGDANFVLGDTKFEARVVITINIESNDMDDLTPNHYRGKRWTRHGSGYNQWWEQERSRSQNVKQMMKQYVHGHEVTGADPFPMMPHSCFYYICVYVKEDRLEAENYKLDMLKSIGAQSAVSCSCMDINPLILCGRRNADRRKCMTPGCKKVEKYCCNTYRCRTRICEDCYSKMCDGRVSIVLDPPCADAESVGTSAGVNVVGLGTESHDHGDWAQDEESNTSGTVDDVGVGVDFLNDADDDRSEDMFFESDEYSDTKEEIDLEDENEFHDINLWHLDDADLSRSGSECSSVEGDSYHDMHSLGNDSADELLGMDVGVAVDGDSDEYVTYANTNYIDEGVISNSNDEDHPVPRTNSGQTAIQVCDKEDDNENPERWYSAPMHVLFNQLGSLCTRFNKRIKGTQFQQHFVQSIVSSMRGISFPLLYLSGMLFPKHFWASSTNDPSAILGVMPISCYRKKNNPDGFASKLQIGRTYATSSCSSTSTDHNFVAHVFDTLANRAQSGRDSRDFMRKGFKVSDTSESGLDLGQGEDSQLHQSLDSMQAARNLAAASQYVGFDVFCTFTLNASKHPGVRHLYDWKESMEWTKRIPNWAILTADERYEVKQSFEMAYTAVLNRNWLETRKLLIEFLIHSARNVLGKDCLEAFFRDEYQESSANVCHLHGLMSLSKEDLSKEEFKEFVCSLQRCAVCDLILTDEIDKYVEEGLLKDVDDWERVIDTADEVLTHKVCNERCQRRVDSTGDDEKDLRCRKRHPVFDSVDPIKDEFLVLPFQFSQECLGILSECGFYEQPTERYPNGRLLLDLLEPRRHMGKVTPSARENMSEVFPKFFALTRSMQNGQIVTDTNGVSRYVVKYIVKLDTGNRCIVWADQHTGAIVRMEKQFLYNTKIASSAKNEDKKFRKSRARNHNYGRYACFAELQHKVLGYPEVQKTMTFCEINSMPSELRPTTKVSLHRNGELRRPDQVQHEDGRSSFGTVHDARMAKFGRQSWRMMSRSQILTLNNGGRSLTMTYDTVSLFSLRPVELIRLFPVIPKYFRWFQTDNNVYDTEEVLNGLNNDITKSVWIDAIGRRVRLRRNAFGEVKEWLEQKDSTGFNDEEKQLKQYILCLIEVGNPCSMHVVESKDHRLPIPVMSSVTPRNPSDFLLHVMLMIGEVKTELDLRCHGSIKEVLASVKLIPDSNLDDRECLKRYSTQLLKRVIREVIPFQAITMRVMQEFIVKCKRLFDSVLLEDAIPLSEIPPCLLTDILNDKAEMLQRGWIKTEAAQLNMIYEQLSNPEDFPSKDEVMQAIKEKPIRWDPLNVMQQSSTQKPESFAEQRVAVECGKRAVDKYCRQFDVTTRTKGVLTHGSPGAGKTYVSFLTVLYSLSQGLRVMTSALMAFRSQCIGGIHLHKLFCMEVSKSNNIFRLAELAVEKLHRKSNLLVLHYLLTMDVLFIDEVGQLSSQQFMQLDIILRHVRENNLPFGGVLIIGTFDHAQQGAIDGTPFLLSSLLTTDFTLVRLTHSVRAHNDERLQEIQSISRMNPDQLIGNTDLEARFKTLVSETFQFVPCMSDPAIGPNHQRMYAKRRNAAAAAEEYVTTSAAHLELEGVRHRVVRSEDYQRTAHSNATFREATDRCLLSAINKNLREPASLLFYQGAFFESTVNSETYSYSQVLYMRDIPAEEDLRSWANIILWVKPPTGTTNFTDMETGQIPSEAELLARNWKKVKVKVAMERLIQCNHLEGGRKQYTLRHLGASTINRTMGMTIIGPVAIEMSEECMPWEKEQIVVMISRTRLGIHIYIVGNKQFAIKFESSSAVNQYE